MRVATPLYPKFLDQPKVSIPPSQQKSSIKPSSSTSPSKPIFHAHTEHSDLKDKLPPTQQSDSSPSSTTSTTSPSSSSFEFSRVTSGAKWEPLVGYCRALRAGNMIYVSGTAPINPDGSTASPGDAYLQTKRCLEIIQESLKELDADMKNIVRTRMYVTDIQRWEEYGRAHSEVFDTPEKRPVTSMLEVKALISPDMLIEIEAEAIIT